MTRLFKRDLEEPVKAIIREQVPGMIETVISNMVPHLLEIAIIKGQVEVTELLYRQVVKEMNKTNTQPSEYESLHAVLHVIGRVNYNFRRQLDHAATTEVSEEMTKLMKDANAEMDTIIENSPAKKYFNELPMHLAPKYTEGDAIREHRFEIMRKIDEEFRALKLLVNKYKDAL